MSHYAIGDLQGCFHEFQTLLAHIDFNPSRDTLWLVGDLVNRGPDSLACLRFIKQHENSILPILGNHDLHLLAVHHGFASSKRQDTLDAILNAPDRAILLDWLAAQPLLRQCGDTVIVHAGIWPEWTLETAQQRAREAEESIRRQPQHFFAHMYGNQPDSDSPKHSEIERLRFTTNVFTRMRTLHTDGSTLRLNHSFKAPLNQLPPDLKPWFAIPRPMSHPIVFGHWSALGLHQEANTTAIDTGALWGGQLTALNLETGQILQVASQQPAARFS